MLSLLHIENIAIIESADISFDRGFNVLTGETGAGKSIVIDAISAVLGQRTSRELIRTGAKSALVTAVFTGLPELPWLAQNGFVQGDELLLQREIQGDGRNACRLDGRPLTVAQLRELGRQLLDIHGQHDGQQLLDPSCHLTYLDSFGKTAPLLADYRQAYETMAGLKKQIASLEMDEAERSRRVDTLNYQIRELERADLKPGEDEELDARKNLLRSAGKLMDGLQAAEFALSGSENSQGACDLIADAEGAVRSITRYSGQMAELGEKLTALRSAAEDVAEMLQDLGRELDFSPEELDQLEGRLDVIYRLKKKYGATVDDMLDYLEQCRRELDQIQYADDTIARLEGELAKAKKTALQKGEVLSAARKEAALALQKRVQEELRQLDMPKVRFETEFLPSAGEDGMDTTGMDQVQFLMSANVGEALKPIQKVASGGELARIMLALKNVLAEDDGIGSLVFDEVDTGVSGRAAQKVAEKMADVARRKQVLCVTHLPQIAAMADAHFSVEKGERGGRTYTRVERLDRQGRENELARLMGGGAVSDTLRQSAGELLTQAEEYRKVGASPR
ncbi:DNA repair protein RecN [Pseudoflavonifractor phocaeensis]|uniref:DNA repair protein RecN n=1 Tax=Pseudoflavonifractor phocaeensis TaxID=1870988 RepID=UPI001F028BD7|nr:DNA repair protein RecN [Pseudoflavonifractor phocaeensis]MCF2596505.1 DNA repair protein RecN [Pseudoflavonifractor phocaeensis]